MNSGKEIRYIFNGVYEPHEKSSINIFILFCWIGAKLFFTEAVSFFTKLNLICGFFYSDVK